MVVVRCEDGTEATKALCLAMRDLVGGFLQRPSTGLGDPAPLASHMDNSEEKTCFVPVYFHELVKKSVS